MNFKAIGQELCSSIEIYTTISKLCNISIRSELQNVMTISETLDKLPESITLNLKRRRFGKWKLIKQHNESFELMFTNCPFWGVRYNKVHQPCLLCRRSCDRFIQLLKHKYNVIELWFMKDYFLSFFFAYVISILYFYVLENHFSTLFFIFSQN